MKFNGVVLFLSLLAFGCGNTPGSSSSPGSDTDVGADTTDVGTDPGDVGADPSDAADATDAAGDPAIDVPDANDTSDSGDGGTQDVTEDAGSVCGNGATEPDEECDDGNDVDGDGCSTTCEWDCEDRSAPLLQWMDADGDGFGDPRSFEVVCSGAAGYVDNALDCDDDDDEVSPAATEVCDGIDNDCDPTTDEMADDDGDGASVCDGDCDDADPLRGPTLDELLCDGIDNDCDAATGDDATDTDGDGFTFCGGDCEEAGDIAGCYAGYPDSGDWNTYVADDGADYRTASGAPCAETGLSGCLHAGELRRIELIGFGSCDEITQIDDTLGALQWDCVEEAGALAAYSIALRPEAGLRDLVVIDADGPRWAQAALVVEMQDGTIIETAPGTWWTNAVVDLQASVPNLADAGTVYVSTASAPLGAIQIGSGVSVVAAPFAVEVDPQLDGGELTDAIRIENASEVWIEGELRANGEDLLVANDVQRLVLRHLRLERVDGWRGRGARLTIIEGLRASDFWSVGHPTGGVVMETVTDMQTERLVVVENVLFGLEASELGGRLEGIWAADNYGYGVRINQTESPTSVHIEDTVLIGNQNGGRFDLQAGDRLYRVVSAANDHTGILQFGGVSHRLRAVSSSSAGSSGELISIADNAVATDVLAVSHPSVGIEVSGASIVQQASVFNVSGNGFEVGNGTLHNVLASNGDGSGLQGEWGFAQIIDASFTDFASGDLDLFQAFQAEFHGLLNLSGDNACVPPSGPSPGIDAACTLTDGSSGTVTLDPNLGAVLGPLAMDDPLNDSDTDGGARFESIVDWSGFGNPWRMWSFDAFAGSPLARLGCGPGSVCRIWDFTPTADSGLLDLLAAPDPILDAHVHVFDPTQVASCADTPGGTTDGLYCPVTFLSGAVELFNDGIGNDNGLCETMESCLVLRNLGAYQGHGPLAFEGAVNGVDLVGVHLYRYGLNGE